MTDTNRAELVAEITNILFGEVKTLELSYTELAEKILAAIDRRDAKREMRNHLTYKLCPKCTVNVQTEYFAGHRCEPTPDGSGYRIWSEAAPPPATERNTSGDCAEAAHGTPSGPSPGVAHLLARVEALEALSGANDEHVADLQAKFDDRLTAAESAIKALEDQVKIIVRYPASARREFDALESQLAEIKAQGGENTAAHVGEPDKPAALAASSSSAQAVERPLPIRPDKKGRCA